MMFIDDPLDRLKAQTKHAGKLATVERSDLDYALSEIDRLKDLNEWQPIETAPDNIPVLLTAPKLNAYRFVIGKVYQVARDRLTPFTH